MSYEQHRAELAECILKGGTIWKKDGSGKLTHSDFKSFADIHFTMPDDAINPLVEAWVSEQGTSEVQFMEIMLNAMAGLANTFLALEMGSPWEAMGWSTIQEENYDV